MAAIKSTADIAKKWATVTPQRAPDYEAGVRDPRKDWATNTVAAADAYKDGVTKAIAAGSFSKGVTRAGTAKWQEQTLAKGPGRWSQGVALGESAYEAGFAPFRDAISRVTLPPRFARRDVRNLLRVAAITEALGKVKAAQ